MVHYKLHYFEIRGLGEAIRQLFSLGDVDYEDIRYSFDEWMQHKNDFPFRQIPVLEVDGVQIPQSCAIARYLARKFGYAGKTPEEEAWVDAFVDQFKDFYAEQRSYRWSANSGRSVVTIYNALGIKLGDAEEEKKKCLLPSRDKFFPILEKYLSKSKSGFLVDSGLTYADLLIIENLTTMISQVPNLADGYPKIIEWKRRVLDHPGIKAHNAKRSFSEI